MSSKIRTELDLVVLHVLEHLYGHNPIVFRRCLEIVDIVSDDFHILESPFRCLCFDVFPLRPRVG